MCAFVNSKREQGLSEDTIEILGTCVQSCSWVFSFPALLLFVFKVSVLSHFLLTLTHTPRIFAKLLLLYLLNSSRVASMLCFARDRDHAPCQWTQSSGLWGTDHSGGDKQDSPL